MSALDRARRAVERFDDFKRTTGGRILADGLAEDLRALVAEVDAERREASIRELHHFEVEQAIEEALSLMAGLMMSPSARAERVEAVLRAAVESKPDTRPDVEWEYGARHSQGTNPHPSRKVAEQYVESRRRGEDRLHPSARGKSALVRRRKAGEWEVVSDAP